MRHRWLTIVASLVAFGASVYGLGFVQQQFFPASNRPELLVTMTLPKNASIAATEAQTERLEKVLASSPDISRFSSYVGGGAIRFYLPLDVQLDNDFLAETVIVAKDLEARDRVQAMLQQRLARDFPDVTARVSRLELGPPVGWPVQYRVSAPTTDEARHYAEAGHECPAWVRPRAQRQLRLGREEQGAAHRRRPGSRPPSRAQLRAARQRAQPGDQRL